jgi:hypothetical protein
MEALIVFVHYNIHFARSVGPIIAIRDSLSEAAPPTSAVKIAELYG